MLDGMHAESSEGLDIRVAVMKGMDLLVDWPEVQKTMREIKVEISPDGREAQCSNERCDP